jgi:hypothetical protein
VSAKNRNNGGKRPQQPAKKQTTVKPAPSKMVWIVGAIAAVAVIGLAYGILGPKTAGAASIPAEEARYIGRYLPAGYQEQSVASPTTYSSTIRMTDAPATQGKTSTSIPLSSVTTSKIVYFEYKLASGTAIPMIAYVKPSGRLFVGVGYCIPCKGTRQRIDADGTLTCESCGTKRSLETIAGLSGGCKLYPLDEIPATVSGGQITLQNSSLDSWTPQPNDRKSGGA